MTSLLTLGGAKFEHLSVSVTFFFVCENNASFGIGIQFSELPKDMFFQIKQRRMLSSWFLQRPVSTCVPTSVEFDLETLECGRRTCFPHSLFKSALHRCTLVDYVTPQRYGRERENTCTMESFRYFCIQKCVRDNKRYCTTLVRINATRDVVLCTNSVKGCSLYIVSYLNPVCHSTAHSRA